MRDLKNFQYSQPYHQVRYFSDILLFQVNWKIEEKMNALQKITYGLICCF